MLSVAPSLSAQGVETFRVTASAESFLKRSKDGNIILVFEESGEINGVVELKDGRHIVMLFVKPALQNKGVGRTLISAVMAYARSDIITVNASLNAVPAYIRYGFACAGSVGEKSGLTYQPMTFKPG